MHLSQEYQQKLEKIVDEITEQKSCPYQCPVFYFKGIDFSKHTKMRVAANDERKKYFACAVS